MIVHRIKMGADLLPMALQEMDDSDEDDEETPEQRGI